jgi:hypothetical protein
VFDTVSDMEVDRKVNSYLIQCQMWKRTDCLIQCQTRNWTEGEQFLHRVSDVELDRWLNSYFIQCHGSGWGVKVTLYVVKYGSGQEDEQFFHAVKIIEMDKEGIV